MTSSTTGGGIDKEALRRLLVPADSHDEFGEECDAAVLVAFVESERAGQREVRLLLTQRARQLRTHAGEVSFPGGRRDDADADLVSTALRESNEEIGLAPGAVEILGLLSPVFTRRAGKVLPCVAWIRDGVEMRINPGEVQAVFSVPTEFFCQENVCAHEIFYAGKMRRIPRFQYGDYDIWGFTASVIGRVCAELLNSPLDLDVLDGERVQPYEIKQVLSS